MYHLQVVTKPLSLKQRNLFPMRNNLSQYDFDALDVEAQIDYMVQQIEAYLEVRDANGGQIFAEFLNPPGGNSHFPQFHYMGLNILSDEEDSDDDNEEDEDDLEPSVPAPSCKEQRRK